MRAKQLIGFLGANAGKSASDAIKASGAARHVASAEEFKNLYRTGRHLIDSFAAAIGLDASELRRQFKNRGVNPDTFEAIFDPNSGMQANGQWSGSWIFPNGLPPGMTASDFLATPAAQGGASHEILNETVYRAETAATEPGVPASTTNLLLWGVGAFLLFGGGLRKLVGGGGRRRGRGRSRFGRSRPRKSFRRGRR